MKNLSLFLLLATSVIALGQARAGLADTAAGFGQFGGQAAEGARGAVAATKATGGDLSELTKSNGQSNPVFNSQQNQNQWSEYKNTGPDNIGSRPEPKAENFATQQERTDVLEGQGNQF